MLKHKTINIAYVPHVILYNWDWKTKPL